MALTFEQLQALDQKRRNAAGQGSVIVMPPPDPLDAVATMRDLQDLGGGAQIQDSSGNPVTGKQLRVVLDGGGDVDDLQIVDQGS